MYAWLSVTESTSGVPPTVFTEICATWGSRSRRIPCTGYSRRRHRGHPTRAGRQGGDFTKVRNLRHLWCDFRIFDGKSFFFNSCPHARDPRVTDGGSLARWLKGECAFRLPVGSRESPTQGTGRGATIAKKKVVKPFPRGVIRRVRQILKIGGRCRTVCFSMSVMGPR